MSDVYEEVIEEAIDEDYAIPGSDESVVEKKGKNSNLTKAKKVKNDEFYTQLSDIEKELSHYDPAIFKDKVIYCPMDLAWTDGQILQSQFVKYFQIHAHRLGYKKLIATCLLDKANDLGQNKYIITRRLVSYCTPENQARSKSPIGEQWGDIGMEYVYQDGHTVPIPNVVVNQVVRDETGYLDNAGSADGAPQYWTYTDNWDGDNTHCEPDEYYGSGDFRSKECRALLEEADIVITNPPFSLFREVLQWLCNAEKYVQFLILGNKNALTYKEVFPLIKSNLIWLGYESPHDFMKPDKTLTSQVNGLCRWFTNIDIDKRHEKLILTKRYYDDPSQYPKYDNYDAINVDKTKDIPEDYFEHIGVPISFLDKFNPDQFEIVDADYNLAQPIKQKDSKLGKDRFYISSEREQAIICPVSHSAEEIIQTLKDMGYSDKEVTYVRGIIGVPISFLDKYNPDQFEIVKFRKGGDGKDLQYRQRESGDSLLQDSDSQKIKIVKSDDSLCIPRQPGLNLEWLQGVLEEFYPDIEIVYHNGVIGVPISFLDKYNPEQFEVVGRADANIAGEDKSYYIPGFKDKGGAPMIRSIYIQEDSCTFKIKIRRNDDTLIIPRQAGISLKWLYDGLKEAYSDEEFTYCSGVMGVPISFLDKYCPEQFEVVCLQAGNTRATAPKGLLEMLNYKQHAEDRGGCGVINGKRSYARVLILSK